MNIVGISGQAGSGKDTVADCFVDNGYTKVSLADPMKRLAYNVFDFSEEQLWGPSERRNAEDIRYYKDSLDWAIARASLQIIGPDWLRQLLPEATIEHRVIMFDSLKQWFEQLYTEHPNLSPRVCLQTLGTEWGRENCHLLVWVAYMHQAAERLLEPGTSNTYNRVYGICKDTEELYTRSGVVVPDVRFQNELEFFTHKGLNVVRLHRPASDGDAAGVGVQEHKSEMEQQGFDPDIFSAIIENTGTLDQLLGTVETLAKQYRTKEQP